MQLHNRSQERVKERPLTKLKSDRLLWSDRQNFKNTSASCPDLLCNIILRWAEFLLLYSLCRLMPFLPTPHPTPTHRSTALQGHLAGLLHPWPCLPPSITAEGGKGRKKKYKIEELLQIRPWLWLGWGLTYNEFLISFTEGREWAAATENEANIHIQNNQLSADFGADRDSLLLHFSHPVSTANHSQKCSGSTSPALNEQPVNFIHKNHRAYCL